MTQQDPTNYAFRFKTTQTQLKQFQQKLKQTLSVVLTLQHSWGKEWNGSEGKKKSSSVEVFSSSDL